MPMCLCKPPITREESWPHHCAACRGVPWPTFEPVDSILGEELIDGLAERMAEDSNGS